MNDLVRLPSKLIRLHAKKNMPDKAQSLGMILEVARERHWGASAIAGFMGIPDHLWSKWRTGNLHSMTAAHQRIAWIFWMHHVKKDDSCLDDPLVMISWGNQKHGMPKPTVTAVDDETFRASVEAIEARAVRGDVPLCKDVASEFGVSMPVARRMMREAGLNKPYHLRRAPLVLERAEVPLFLSQRNRVMLLPCHWLRQKHRVIEVRDGEQKLGTIRFTEHRRIWLHELEPRAYYDLGWHWLDEQKISPGTGRPISWLAYLNNLRAQKQPFRRVLVHFRRETLIVPCQKTTHKVLTNSDTTASI